MANRTPLVACLGIITQDLIFRVPDLPAGDGKYLAADLDIVGGGVAANGAVTAARLGCRARLAGWIGTDAVGNTSIAELRDEGVDPTFIGRLHEVGTPVSAVLIDDAGRRVVVNRADERLFTDQPIDADAFVAGADVVLVDGRWPDGARRVLRSARRLGIPAVVDVDRPLAAEHLDLLQLGTHIAFSREALISAAGTEDLTHGLRTIANTTDGWVCVTGGEDGVWWLDGTTGEIRHRAGFAVVVVDTVAAGDVFHGALAVAIAEGQTIESAVAFSSAAAAIKCSQPGGRRGIPTRSQLREFLADRDLELQHAEKEATAALTGSPS